MQCNHGHEELVNLFFNRLFVIHQIELRNLHAADIMYANMQNPMERDLNDSGASIAAASAAEPRLLAAEVVERLRDMIIQGELAPGVKLNERVLCERLRTSRTPVREAIKYLASEGLVELLPNRGAIVTPITATTGARMFVLLGALEALAGELACANASDATSPRSARCIYQMLAHHARGELAPYFRWQPTDTPAPGRVRRQCDAGQPLPRLERPCAPRALHGQSVARALGPCGGGA